MHKEISSIIFLLFSLHLHCSAQTLLTDSIPPLLKSKLVAVDSLLEAGNFQESQRGIDQSVEITKNYKNDYARAWVLQQQGKLSHYQKNYDQSVRYFLQSNTLLRSLKTPAYTKITDNLIFIAQAYEAQNALQIAAEYYMQASNVYKNELMLNKQIATLKKAGHIYITLNDFEAAKENFNAILKIYVTRQNAMGQIDVLGELININNLNNNYNDALMLNQQLLEIYTEVGDSTGMATALNNIGFDYARLGQHQEALVAFKQAYQTDEQLYGKGLQNQNTLLNIGITYQNLGNTTQAIEYLLKALEIKEGQKDWLGAASIHNLMAKVYLFKQDFHNANLHVESAIAIANTESDGILMADSYSIKSDIMQKFGDYEEALRYYRQYLSVRDSISNEQNLESERLRKLDEELEKKDEELREKIAEEQQQKIVQQQLLQDIKLLEAENKIVEYVRNEEKLENEKKLNAIATENQQLRISQLEIEKQRKELEIKEREALRIQEQNEFENQRKLQQAELERKEDEIKLQEKELEIKEQASKIGRTILIFVFLGLIMSLLWLLTARRQNKALAKQKDEIKLKNAELEQKTEEVLTQSESLRQANQEIIKSHDELEAKNQEIKKQNKTLETQNVAIKESYQKLEDTLKKLKTAQTKLIESEKMASLGQLTAGIAHEINNPINFISGNINPLKRDISDIKELLEKIKHFQNGHDKDVLIADINTLSNEIELDVLMEEVDDLMMGIEEGAKRTKEIVLGLRNFSRLDENDYKLADINQGIMSTVTLLKSKMRDRITLHTDFGNLPKVDCLPGQLNQVFMNIINNAVQAIKGVGNIYIKTFLDQNEKVKITISDDGEGMEEEIKNKIFDPFFTTKDVGEGTGLGLSISYGIIKEQHKGEIVVESKIGEGTAFIITLPLKQHTA